MPGLGGSRPQSGSKKRTSPTPCPHERHPIYRHLGTTSDRRTALESSRYFQLPRHEEIADQVVRKSDQEREHRVLEAGELKPLTESRHHNGIGSRAKGNKETRKQEESGQPARKGGSESLARPW